MTMKKYTLNAVPRDITGRKVKNLRRQGNIPATVYGKNVKSVSIQVGGDEFRKLYAQTGETGLIELSLGSDKRPVLVHTVQVHPVGGHILHIEFHQVDLKEKVTAKVPVEFTGEAGAVVDKKGVLLTILDEVDVEALPTDIPQKIELDVSGLVDVDQELKVSDLKVPHGVTILTDSEQTLVKVGSLVSKEAEAEAAEEAAKAAEVAAAVAPPAEGEAPAEDLPAGSPRDEAGKAGKKEAPEEPKEEKKEEKSE